MRYGPAIGGNRSDLCPGVNRTHRDQSTCGVAADGKAARAEDLWGDWVQGFEQRQNFYSLDESAGREPAASYSRLLRYDVTGLIWLLRGRPVIALTASEAAMRGDSGAIAVYRRRLISRAVT